MRIPFWCLTVLLVYNSLYFVSACDEYACNIGTSAALSIGCNIATGAGGIVSGAFCAGGAVLTFGLSCVGSLLATGIAAWGCSEGQSGKTS